MYLIAESGATKTTWALIDGKKKKIFRTSGINPQILNELEINKLFEEELFDRIPGNMIKKIFFYGAGCSTEINKKKIITGLSKKLKGVEFYIDHDLNAAGRALFGAAEGIACILGTGSNSGIYKQGKIVNAIPSLGYLLGDEGSGVHLSKIFIRDLIYGISPEGVLRDFYEQYDLDKDKLLNEVYFAKKPNVYLASLAKYIISRNSETYFHNLIYKSFDEFFKYHIVLFPGYDKYNIGVVGSVGYYSQAIMKKVATAYDLQISSFIQNPIDGLIEYHLNLQS